MNATATAYLVSTLSNFQFRARHEKIAKSPSFPIRTPIFGAKSRYQPAGPTATSLSKLKKK
jgi:hypothetical protein